MKPIQFAFHSPQMMIKQKNNPIVSFPVQRLQRHLKTLVHYIENSRSSKQRKHLRMLHYEPEKRSVFD